MTTAPALTPRQRSHLTGLSHPLKPLIHVGKEGVTVPTLRTIRQAFNTRELLKVKVLENAPQTPRETGEALVAQLEDVALVRTIGRVLVLYRPDPKRPQITLPTP